MENSRINYCHSSHRSLLRSHPKKIIGLTLIEVLIALAVIGIALTAIIKATTQTIRSTRYLQDKTIAMWVGQQVLNEARVGILKLSDLSVPHQNMTTMLGSDWYWSAAQEDTPNKHIKKIAVSVYTHEINAEDETPIIRLESYLYAEP